MIENLLMYTCAKHCDKDEVLTKLLQK